MKKLVIINHEPLTEHTKKLWKLDELSERGVNVRYWDIRGLINDKIVYNGTIDDERLTIIGTYKQFKDLLSKEDKSNTLFVDEFPCYWKNVWLRFYLKYTSCHLARFHLFYYPKDKSVEENGYFGFFRKLSKLPTWSLVNFTKIFKLRDYDVVFSPFEKGRNKTITINLPDYEIYIRNKDLVSEGNTIVFIDSYFPLHPDFKIIDDFQCTESDINHYRAKMIDLFDSLEHRFNKKVIIAAHPKSDYKGDEFGNREIKYGETCKLVLSSSMVVSHNSNADAFAIMSDKPLIYLCSDLFNSIKCGYLYQHIYDKASRLGLTVFNIDEVAPDSITPMSISDDKKQQFIYSSYTSKESEGRLNADIISDYLLNS